MKTLIINAHPDPHAAEAATNRMVQHLVARLPAGSTEIVNLAEADIQMRSSMPCFNGSNPIPGSVRCWRVPVR